MKQIDANLLDIAARDTDFALCYEGKPLKTPGGAEVASHDPRALEHILRDICISGNIDWTDANACSAFAVEKDFIPSGRGSVMDSLPKLLADDPVLIRKFKRPQPGDAGNETNALEEQQMAFPLYFTGISGTARCISAFIVEQTQGKINFADITPEGFAEATAKALELMSSTEFAAALLLLKAHGAGILLPTLLVTGQITVSEYANALLSMGARPMDKTANTCLPLPDIQTATPDPKNPVESFQTILRQTASIMDYTKTFQRDAGKERSVKEIIEAGESFSVEFKSSLRWNIKAEKKDPAIEHASLKTIAAFLNSSGGTLLIGVRDDGSIEGIETDMFPDTDRFSLHFWNLAKTSFGQDICPFIKTHFEKLEERTVFAITAVPSPRPVFLKNKNEDEFYTRIGPSSAKLGIREALNYITGRFDA